jgi:hypothetical protein
VIRQTAIVHCPRVLAVLAGNLLDRVGSAQAKRRYTRLIARFEGLAKLPTRYASGHFVAALAVKRA